MPCKYRILVKGDPSCAMVCAIMRGLDPRLVGELSRFDETVMEVTDPSDIVPRWYVEPGQAPYPPGTLLYYSERK